MSKLDKNKVLGKYAAQRVEFLEEHAPDMLETMVNDGSIYEHLELVQNMSSKYIDSYVDKIKQTDEYKKAESDCDLVEMNKIINTAQVIAETAIGVEWVFSLPDDDEEIKEDADKDFDNMSYDEAVQDIYNDVHNLKAAVSNLDSDENGTEDEE